MVDVGVGIVYQVLVSGVDVDVLVVVLAESDPVRQALDDDALVVRERVGEFADIVPLVGEAVVPLHPFT